MLRRIYHWLSILVLAVAVGSTAAAEPALLPQDLLDAGWISLFDGETLFGWQRVGDAQWQVEDGEVVTGGKQPGWLMSTSRWANFELQLEFKAAPGTNSGVFLRSALEPTDVTSDCCELNIAPPDNPFPTGSFVGRQKATGRATNLSVPNHWHTFTVIFDGNEWEVSVDGQRILKYVAPAGPTVGRIGLQAREGTVAFRNIRLRPLGLKPIFNGRDLAGWSTAGAEKSEFEVTETGELQVVNGPGQIATESTYADFVLQLDCRVNGDGLNSGVFFRTLPTGRWQGYESQVHNGFRNSDRTQPVDFGTGGIYRRQPARRVIPHDHEWFTKTIVADGPLMAVWVNGYQVSDWTDERAPHENPREGRRLGPGSIAIQGHDPTTDLSFRKLRIFELPTD